MAAAITNQENWKTQEIDPHHGVGQRFTKSRKDIVRAYIDLAFHGPFRIGMNDQVIFLILEFSEDKIDVCEFAPDLHGVLRRRQLFLNRPVFWA